MAVAVPSTSQIGCSPRSRAEFGALHYERSGTHAEDHPVAAAVERDRRLGDVLVGGGRPAREEAGAEPAEELVGGDVVGCDHDDATATAGSDPVLGEAHGLGGAGACRVDLCVRASGADEVGELGVPHRQDMEQEAAIEAVWVVVDQLAEVVQSPVDLVERHVSAFDFDEARPDRLQLGPLLASGVVCYEGARLCRELLDPGERGGEDHAGVVA